MTGFDVGDTNKIFIRTYFSIGLNHNIAINNTGLYNTLKLNKQMHLH